MSDNIYSSVISGIYYKTNSGLKKSFLKIEGRYNWNDYSYNFN